MTVNGGLQLPGHLVCFWLSMNKVSVDCWLWLAVARPVAAVQVSEVYKSAAAKDCDAPGSLRWRLQAGRHR